MVREAALSLSAITLLATCSTDLRDMEICKLNPQANIAYCAKGEARSEKPLTDLQNWYSVSETDLRKIADKLEDCERQKPTDIVP